GFLHLYIGQEAVAGGAISAAEPADYIGATYRGHAPYLARPGDAPAAMAELYGRATGARGGGGGARDPFAAGQGILGGGGGLGGRADRLHRRHLPGARPLPGPHR